MHEIIYAKDGGKDLGRAGVGRRDEAVARNHYKRPHTRGKGVRLCPGGIRELRKDCRYENDIIQYGINI